MHSGGKSGPDDAMSPFMVDPSVFTSIAHTEALVSSLRSKQPGLGSIYAPATFLRLIKESTKREKDEALQVARQFILPLHRPRTRLVENW